MTSASTYIRPNPGVFQRSAPPPSFPPTNTDNADLRRDNHKQCRHAMCSGTCDIKCVPAAFLPSPPIFTNNSALCLFPVPQSTQCRQQQLKSSSALCLFPCPSAPVFTASDTAFRTRPRHSELSAMRRCGCRRPVVNKMT